MAKRNSVKVDGISYSTPWVKTHTEQEFISEFAALPFVYAGASDRESRLRKVYKAIIYAVNVNEYLK